MHSGGYVYKTELQTSLYNVTTSSGDAPSTHVLGNGVNSALTTSDVDGCGTSVKLGGTHYARALEFLDANTFIVGGWYGGRMLKVDATTFCTTTIVPLNTGLNTATFTIHPNKQFLLSAHDDKIQKVDLSDPTYPVTVVAGQGSTSGNELVTGPSNMTLLGSQFSTSGRGGHMSGIAFSPDGSFALLAWPAKSILKITT